jgi:hypothetical protein
MEVIVVNGNKLQEFAEGGCSGSEQLNLIGRRIDVRVDIDDARAGLPVGLQKPAVTFIDEHLAKLREVDGVEGVVAVRGKRCASERRGIIAWQMCLSRRIFFARFM